MGNSWSYVPNDKYKSADDLVEKLCDIVSKGGNFLLNVGPSPEGEFDAAAYDRLKKIGEWMKINGESIYGSRMFTVFNEGDRIRFNQSKDGRIKYIFFFDFPQGKIMVTKMPIKKGAKISMLGASQNLKWKQKKQDVEITIPASLESISKYVWVLKVQE
jgi:alpha-L-fucosidase